MKDRNQQLFGKSFTYELICIPLLKESSIKKHEIGACWVDHPIISLGLSFTLFTGQGTFQSSVYSLTCHIAHNFLTLRRTFII